MIYIVLIVVVVLMLLCIVFMYVNNRRVAELSDKLMKSRMEEFRNDNRRELASVLDPLHRQIEEFNREFRGVSQATRDSSKTLHGEIDLLMRLNRNIGEEAAKLSRALRGNVKAMGDWGEQILQTMLENSGLVKDRDFIIQQSRDDSGQILLGRDGKRKRPDAVINLPENRKIIVDSKVSLNAYIDYLEAENEEAKSLAARRLVESVKAHISEIKRADYPAVIEGSCEMVVMFMPNEGAYFAAMQQEPKLWQMAYDSNVTLATPTHFFAVVQMVSMLWRQDARDRNAEEIGKTAGLLYDKLVDFTKKLESVGQRIEQAQDAYSKTLNSMVRGKTSVTSLAEKLKDMGASVSTKLSERLLDEPDGV